MAKSLYRLLLVLPLVAVAACAPQGHLPKADVRLPSAFEARQAGGDKAVSLDLWWQDFRDPQMAGLIATALERSTTIRMAYARIAEARAQRSQARATTLPTGNISGSAVEQGSERLSGTGTTKSGYDTYQLSLFPSWEIDLFGRLSAIRAKADLDRAASAFDFEGTRLALAADVASNLVQARLLAVQLADARDNLAIGRQLANSAALGEARGLTSSQDAARLRADAASGEAEVERLTGELQVAKRSLLILIGEPAAATDTLVIAADLPAAPDLPEVTPGLLLARRPDVRSAEAALLAQGKQVQIDRLALFPKFNLQSGASGQGLVASGGPLGGATALWSVAAGLTMPVLDRPRLMAGLRISEARGRQAVISYERSVQTAFGEAENALTRVAAGRRRVGQLAVAEDASHKAFEAARRGYAAGLTDLTSLTQIQRTWIQNRGALAVARAGQLTQTITAIRALGGGWQPAPSPLEPTLQPEAR